MSDNDREDEQLLATIEELQMEVSRLKESLAFERLQIEQADQVLRDRGLDPGKTAALLPQRVDGALGYLQREARRAEERASSVAKENASLREVGRATELERDAAMVEVRITNAYAGRKEEDNEKAWAECRKFRRLYHEAKAEAERLKGVVRKSCDEHIALAAQYERGGNTRGAMHLRATGNLLGAIYQGNTPTTIYPSAQPVPAGGDGGGAGE